MSGWCAVPMCSPLPGEVSLWDGVGHPRNESGGFNLGHGQVALATAIQPTVGLGQEQGDVSGQERKVE